MTAPVLAGGTGTRLRPITHTSAKQLPPVATKPVLFYGLESIRDAGITDVGIIVGGITDLVARFQASRPDAQIMLTRCRTPPVRCRGARRRRQGDRPREEAGTAEERPRTRRVYIFGPAVHEAVANLKPSWRGELEITDAIQWLIDHGGQVLVAPDPHPPRVVPAPGQRRPGIGVPTESADETRPLSHESVSPGEAPRPLRNSWI